MIFMKRILPLVILIALIGCGKTDEIAPVITMVSPTNNLVVAGGQTVAVQGTITDNEEIHMIHAICTDNLGGHLLHFEEHVDTKSYNLNQSFPTISGRTYTLEVQATDHGDNVTTKTITVTTN